MFKRILVTGAGGPGAINLSRSLLKMRPQPWILAADASPHYVYLALAHERALVPRASEEGAYIETINRLIDDHHIDFIFPNNSLEIRVLSEHRDALGAPVFLPEVQALDTANSKWLSYQAFERAGLPIPRTILIEDADQLQDAFSSLQTDDESPVWVRGAGIPGKGIGVASLPCRTVAQAEQWVEYWRGWGEMAASEYLPGDNLTWMGLFNRGELVTSQGRRRLAYVIPHVSPSGITGAPAISETIHDAEVNRLGFAAVKAIDPNYHGVAFVDMKGDDQGQPRLTEVNAGRFGTTHFFYSAAGANFPEFLLKLASGEELSLPESNLLPEGLVWIRTLDASPVLTTREAVNTGVYPTFREGRERWPRVPQSLADFSVVDDPFWPPKEEST